MYLGSVVSFSTPPKQQTSYQWTIAYMSPLMLIYSDSLFFLPILVRGFLLYISYALRKRFTLLMIFVDYVCVCALRFLGSFCQF
jgi:hypothetical protein